MKVVYIAGKFTASNAWYVEKNVRRAEEAGLAVATLGAAPLIPHANTRFFHGTITNEFWYEATLALLRKCDAVLLLNDWKHSKGAVAEKTAAEALGIPTFERFNDLKIWLGEQT